MYSHQLLVALRVILLYYLAAVVYEFLSTLSHLGFEFYPNSDFAVVTPMVA